MSYQWEIGMDVVCLDTHRLGAFKEGDIFIIKGISTSPCKCGTTTIDIGIKTIPNRIMSRCVLCRDIFHDYGIIWWFHERHFAPLSSLFSIAEFDHILKKPLGEDLRQLENPVEQGQPQRHEHQPQRTYMPNPLYVDVP